IYSYHGGDDIWNHLEIEAYAGSVNDLAFAYSNKILSIVTCRDDKLIQTSPFVRFNKDGMLLAVLIHINGIKILANPDGVGLLRTTKNRSFDPSGVASTPVAKNSEKQNLVDRPRIGDEAIDKSRMWKVIEISEPLQCLSLRLPDNTSSLMQVTNLVYTNSGLRVLALVANVVHKLWKWPKMNIIPVGSDKSQSRNVGEEIVKSIANNDVMNQS
ncbi:topless-related protein 4-like protein isoform X1, partial [Tanacetum coccineum]